MDRRERAGNTTVWCLRTTNMGFYLGFKVELLGSDGPESLVLTQIRFRLKYLDSLGLYFVRFDIFSIISSFALRNVDCMPQDTAWLVILSAFKMEILNFEIPLYIYLKKKCGHYLSR